MGPIDSIEPGGAFSRGDNDRGMALIIVLVMLLLFSILGATMLATSTSELKIAGNYRNSEESFYTAEAALAFAVNYDQIYLDIDTSGNLGTTWPVAGQGAPLDANFNAGTINGSNFNRITIPGTNNTADVRVEYVGKCPPPEGDGYDAEYFQAVTYVINVIGYGPSNSQSQVESMNYTIVPKP